MTIKAVDGLPYSEDILRAKVAGDVPFEFTFKWVERIEEEWLEYTSGIHGKTKSLRTMRDMPASQRNPLLKLPRTIRVMIQGRNFADFRFC